MGQTIKVGMADLKVCKAPDSLTTIGLGSCVGIALYDPVLKVAGLAHVMLPDSTQIKNNSVIAKFADTGIQKLYDDMVKAGANKFRMVAKIAGGAKMFEMSEKAGLGNIGQRNIESVRLNLRREGIRILAENVGGSVARTLSFFPENGQAQIHAYGKPVIYL